MRVQSTLTEAFWLLSSAAGGDSMGMFVCAGEAETSRILVRVALTAVNALLTSAHKKDIGEWVLSLYFFHVG